jgi:hypothetical protein
MAEQLLDARIDDKGVMCKGRRANKQARNREH